MLTSEIKSLDTAFNELVKRRRGQMIRRGGAGSRDFEISVPYRGHEVLVGVESGWTADDALFLFIRHGRNTQRTTGAHPFLPPRPEGVEEVVGRKLLGPGEGKSGDASSGRAGSSTTATPSSPAGTTDPGKEPPLASAVIPGFSVSVRRLNIGERFIRMVAGRTVHTDKKRPGWFHVEMAENEPVSTHLEPEVRAPLTDLVELGPIVHLSIGMTQHIFRVRRTPLCFNVEEIDRFITVALALFTSALAMPPPIPVIDVPGLFALDMLFEVGRGARCGVCGEMATSRLVQCAKCLTPHHDECWSYGGGCSVFGCGSTVRV